MLKAVVICAYGTRFMTEKNEVILNTRKRKILRKIYGPIIEQEIWKIRNNQ
jgi:hypothetical protein